MVTATPGCRSMRRISRTWASIFVSCNRWTCETGVHLHAPMQGMFYLRMNALVRPRRGADQTRTTNFAQSLPLSRIQGGSVTVVVVW